MITFQGSELVGAKQLSLLKIRKTMNVTVIHPKEIDMQ